MDLPPLANRRPRLPAPETVAPIAGSARAFYLERGQRQPRDETASPKWALALVSTVASWWDIFVLGNGRDPTSGLDLHCASWRNSGFRRKSGLLKFHETRAAVSGFVVIANSPYHRSRALTVVNCTTTVSFVGMDAKRASRTSTRSAPFTIARTTSRAQ